MHGLVIGCDRLGLLLLLGVYARCAYDRKRLGLVRIGGGNRAGQRETRHSTTSTSGSTGARAGWRIGGQSASQTMQGKA